MFNKFCGDIGKIYFLITKLNNEEIINASSLSDVENEEKKIILNSNLKDVLDTLINKITDFELFKKIVVICEIFMMNLENTDSLS
jgi:hypothetical protein